MLKTIFCTILFFLAGSFLSILSAAEFSLFQSPPDSVRPWVYWFIMDGNLSKEGITADLESMKQQGIGGVIFMEVNVGVPRGNVDFMSEQWQELFTHAVHETERLGLQLTLNSGPGWTGSGGPWIKPEQSMLHLVASEKNVTGPATFNEVLPRPTPRKPFFGENALPADQEKARKEFFKDVCVLAFPTPKGNSRITDINEKALYVRAPYSSAPNVKPRIESFAEYENVAQNETIASSKMINLTDHLDSGGVLHWEIPQGDWTILRFAATSNGANTRPAPHPGLGLESSKMDRDYFDIHFNNYITKLLAKIGKRQTDGKAGWSFLHIDSWEMGAQNFSKIFIDEFRKRRNYDPTPFLPAYSGFIVDNVEKTERFLWDVRQTSQELIIQNHGEYLRELAHKNNMKLSVEPYDMMPCCDMSFCAVADVPMCEFWSAGYGYNTLYSCLEATSVAHIHGKQIVGAEAFTSSWDAWRQNPKSMKSQGDWAFCTGINRITFHRFQHQPYLDRVPGFSMGIHGVHWERTQTWWKLVAEYHRYLARCQYLLQQGQAVADILYLLPEGAPEVFTPPDSALTGSGVFRDQRGYRFDGCDPKTLIERATVKNGKVTFNLPNATEYRLLVLPQQKTMTPELLGKIEELVKNGATIIGSPPVKSPSLQNYPQADEEVCKLAAKIWEQNQPDTTTDAKIQTHSYHNGRVITLPQHQKHEHLKLPVKMSGAKWIWFPESDPKYNNPANDAPGETRLFRKIFSLRKDVKIDRAVFLAVADNELTVSINGKTVDQTDLSKPLKAVSFAEFLQGGENVIELKAVNLPSNARNPAGVIGSFAIRFIDENGTPNLIKMMTDETWESSQKENENKNKNKNKTENETKTDWRQAKVLGNFGMPPWSVAEYSGAANASQLYPDYEVLEKIFAADGVVADFISDDDSLRFFHRRDGETEIYFLANKKSQPFEGKVSFRTVSARASIWDPKTGKKYRCDSVTSIPSEEKNRQTTIPLFLEGGESVFVIFDCEDVDESFMALPIWQRAERLAATVLELNDGWTVSFEPLRGAPPKVVFDELQDWTKSGDEGIRHFSGIATYEKKFVLTRGGSPKDKNKERLFLDLGVAEVIARVHLNGKEAGTCWSNPYRLEITDYVQDGENVLQIEVANLWVNRLIGDSQLPEEKRITWTTLKNVYKPGSKLLPSGLIGPVKIKIE
ncbi:MAG: hypothetical protein LBF88_14740 [Planctomycetaceae bacterium]|jgi:hypothetical protein|nr:hypothetical protein [Planctomycetaceae bacterium]